MKKFIVSLLTIFASALFFFSSDAFAFSFGSTGRISVSPYNDTWATVYLNNYDYVQINPSSSNDQSLGLWRKFLRSQSGGTLANFRLGLSDNLPGPALIHISIRYSGTTVDNPTYYAGTYSDTSLVLLNSSCSSPREVTAGSNVLTTDTTCDYFFYSSSTDNYIYIYPRVTFSNNVDISVSPVNFVTVSSDGSGGSSSELQSIIQNQLNIEGLLNNDFNVVVARLQDVISSNNGLRSDFQAQTAEIEQGNEEAQERWEADKAEEAQREEDLSEQSEDVTISAQNPGNPFASLFSTQECQSLPTVSSWFNMDSPIQVCSPYPAQIKPVIQFVSSALVIGLLIRLYFKLFKGGYAS